ncbi:MAG: hypothetical protein ACPL28_12085 [bacterium]
MKRKIVSALALLVLSNLFAKEIPYTLEDRDRLIRIEATLKEFQASVDKRFESIDKRFDQLTNIMIGIVMAFAGIVAVTIGFAIWDRRTMIKPFETKVKGIEEKIKEIDETEVKNLIATLKEIAKVDTRVAEALKKFNLL